MFIVDRARLTAKRHKIAVIFCAFLLTICFLLYGALFTQKGFKLTLAIIEPVLAWQDIRYDASGVEGTLLSFSLPELTIQTDDVTVDIKGIQLGNNPLPFLWGTIDLTHADIDQVLVVVETDDPTDPKQQPELTDDGKTLFPFTLMAQQASIHQATVIVGGNTVATASNIKSPQVGIKNDHLFFKDTDAMAYNELLSLRQSQGRLSFHPPFVMTTQSHISVHHPDVLSSDLDVKLDGPLLKTFSVTGQGSIQTRLKPFDNIDINAHTSINDNQLHVYLDDLRFRQSKISGTINILYPDNQPITYSTDLDGYFYAERLPESHHYHIDLAIMDEKNKTDNHQVVTEDCHLTWDAIDLNCYAQLSTSQAGELSLDKLDVTNDEHQDHVRLSGNLAPKPHLNWDIQINQLGYYLSTLRAVINSHGQFSHDWQQPLINTHTVIKEVQYQNTVLPSIYLDAITDNQQQMLELTLKSLDFSLYTKAAGHWQSQQFNSQLNDLRFKIHKSQWRGFGQPKIDVQPGNINIDQLCATSQQSYFCLSMNSNRNQTKVQSSFNIDAVTFNHLFEDYITTSDIRGSFDYDHQLYRGQSMRYLIKATKGTLSFINIDPSLTKLMNHQQSGSNQIAIEQAFSQGIMNDGALWSQTYLQLDNGDFLANHIKAFNITAKQSKDIYVDSKLKAHFTRLDFLPYLLQMPINFNGKLDADLSLKGTPQQPELAGYTRLSDGQMDWIPLGLVVKDINLDAKAQSPLGFNIKAQAKIGGQPVTADAKLRYDLTNSQMTLSGHLSGDKLAIIQLPQLEVTASPRLSIRQKNRSVELTGQVAIDQADIQIEDLHNLNSVNTFNDDIIYTNRLGQPLEQSASLPVYTDLKVRLGQHTRIYGYGLSSYLRGQLDVISTPNQLTKANGIIYLKEGSFNKYGKRFTISDDSNLSYNYTDIANPNLNVTANYELPPDVALSSTSPSKIGVKIQGTGNNPNIRLFSSPSMSEANILSFIVSGHSLGDKDAANNSNEIQSAALALALNGGSQTILDDVKQTLGADISFGTMTAVPMMSDQLQDLNTQDNEAQTAIYVGKSLTSSFRVSYGISIFTGQQELDTVYQINKNWLIRTDATTLDTGADLIYQFSP